MLNVLDALKNALDPKKTNVYNFQQYHQELHTIKRFYNTWYQPHVVSSVCFSLHLKSLYVPSDETSMLFGSHPTSLWQPKPLGWF